MQTSEAGISLIKRFEGCRLKAYSDIVGVYTIGYGHTGGVKLGTIITEEEAEALLKRDLKRFELSIARLITRRLTQNQFDALVSFCFNLGAGALQRSTLRQKINRMEDSEVPAEFMKWSKAGGRVVPGLLRRRKAEAEFYAALPWQN